MQNRYHPPAQGRDALSDNLSIVTEVFEAKLDEYVQNHHDIRLPSTRAMRNKFFKDEKLHRKFINKAIRLASAHSESTEKSGGQEVFEHVRSQIITAGAEYRADPKPSRRIPKIGILVYKEDMLTESIMAKRWRHQKTYLRVVAAEIEAMGLALFLDHDLLKRKLIRKGQKIRNDSLFWEFSRLSERNFDIVRHLYMS